MNTKIAINQHDSINLNSDEYNILISLWHQKGYVCQILSFDQAKELVQALTKAIEQNETKPL